MKFGAQYLHTLYIDVSHIMQAPSITYHDLFLSAFSGVSR
jgi:hypothetical protein